MPKRALDIDLFADEPSNRRSAYTDLWRWANDRDRVFAIRGQRVSLRRGQLAYSMLTLAERWRWSREKVQAVLTEFQNLGLITFTTSKLTTTITVLDYDIYNPCTSVLDAEKDTESSNASDNGTSNESGIESGNAPDNGTSTEGGREKEEGRRGNARAREEAPLVEGRIVPTDAEVSEFCASYQHLALGISGIPGAWWRGWLAAQLGSGRPFPSNWKRVLELRFTADWMNASSPGHRSARGNLSMAPFGSEKIAKNGGISVGQQKFELDRRLRELEAQEDELYQLNQPLPRTLTDEIEAVKKSLRELNTTQP